jgi:hypothetical protein
MTSGQSIEAIVDGVGHSSENPIKGDSDGTNRFLSSFDFDQPPPPEVATNVNRLKALSKRAPNARSARRDSHNPIMFSAVLSCA